MKLGLNMFKVQPGPVQTSIWVVESSNKVQFNPTQAVNISSECLKIFFGASRRYFPVRSLKFNSIRGVPISILAPKSSNFN